MAWYIKGQVGKALDATARLLSSDLKAGPATLRFENLAADVFQYGVIGQDLLSTDTILPEAGQEISLWDGNPSAGGTRRFVGIVTDPEDQPYGVSVRAEGPWWWLKTIPLESAISGTDRGTMVFPEQSIITSITTLLTRAIANGAPIAIGAMSSAFAIQKGQISLTTFADGLAQLLQWLPDAIAWWDYSVVGDPAFRLTRRGAATNTTYTVGADGLTDYRATPRTTLKVERVELNYMTRGADGSRQRAVQGSGTAGAGKLQVVTVSGEELASGFLPEDDLESFQILTTNANVALNTLKPSIMNMIPQVIQSRAAYSGKPSATDVTLANGEIITTYGDYQLNLNAGSARYYYGQPAFSVRNPVTGAEVSRVGKHLVISPDPVPDWAKDVVTMEEVKISGRIYVKSPSGKITNAGNTSTTDAAPLPDWADAFPWTSQYNTFGWTDQTSFSQPATYNRFQIWLLVCDFELDAWLTTVSYATGPVIYKPQSFSFNAPAAGQAGNLLGTQNWTPYTGYILRKLETVDGAQLMDRKFNIAGGRADQATMGALPKAVTYDLRARSIKVDLGPPARFDFRTLAGRFKVDEQSNTQPA